MTSVRRWGVSAQIALAAVVLSIVLAAVAAVAAVRVEPQPVVTVGDPPESLETAVPERRQAAPESVVFAAVARDPFRAERTRPAVRYQLPGDRLPEMRAAAGPRQRLPIISLVGIAVLSDGKGIAALQVRGRPPRIMRVGDTIEGLELVGIDSVAATLTGSDTTIVLRLPGRSGGEQVP
ncbi:MAG: hypothetical protein OEO20_04075 [Gemmatimonadota bacterium]|nr:hypothetical protein [Gemmatimonadota bacterium]MDH3368770.1 hypothetical protein [Gemmatimonadota bacterium]MDH3477463.1 hypothetical protein [Gemmatimonadota bacterium]MDH3569420.1 hypothetical protein [Gemmatimonadota bacterium]MDH5549246.1 hypothetical protein [Gemmatimonadota bacterium]